MIFSLFGFGWLFSSTSTKSKSSSSSSSFLAIFSFFSIVFSFISFFGNSFFISSFFSLFILISLFGISIIFPKFSKSIILLFLFSSFFIFCFFFSFSSSDSELLSSSFSFPFLLNVKGFILLLLFKFSFLFSEICASFKFGFILLLILLLSFSLTSSKSSSSSSSLFAGLSEFIFTVLFCILFWDTGVELNWISFKLNPILFSSFLVSSSFLLLSGFKKSKASLFVLLVGLLLVLFVKLKSIVLFIFFSSFFSCGCSNFFPIVLSIIIFIIIGFIPPSFAPNINIILVIISIIEL